MGNNKPKRGILRWHVLFAGPEDQGPQDPKNPDPKTPDIILAPGN